jgi:hypothetical protein
MRVSVQKFIETSHEVDEPGSLAKLKSASALSVGIRVPGEGQLLFSSILADSKFVGSFCIPEICGNCYVNAYTRFSGEKKRMPISLK